MKTRHAKGPWYEAKASFYQGLIIDERTGKNIAVSYDKEDARLIAAAPELLLVCRRLAAFNINTPLIDTGLLPDLIAAIAKAEGRAAK